MHGQQNIKIYILFNVTVNLQELHTIKNAPVGTGMYRL